MPVTVSINSEGSARDFAVGSAETFRTKCNATGVTNVALVVDTVSVGAAGYTFVDEATDVTVEAGNVTSKDSCEIGTGGSVGIFMGCVTRETAMTDNGEEEDRHPMVAN